MRPKPVVLIVLDGWGVGPTREGNAIAQANTPNFDSYFAYFPSISLQAAGIAVGLPWGEVGNSEVGHTTMGAGTVLYQNAPRISLAIEDGSFYENSAFVAAADHVKKNHSRIHIIGLISPGDVHCSYNHILALLDMAKKRGISEVFIHAILDGRDTPRDSGVVYIQDLLKQIKEKGVGKIASLSGRFYAMDRNNNWDRTAMAYRAMADRSGIFSQDPVQAIGESYKNNVFDEEFVPTIMTDRHGDPIAQIADNDAVIFANYRADRARQLTKAFTLPGFEKFERPNYIRNLYFVTMTEYEDALPVQVAFPTLRANAPLAKVLSEKGFRQLHIAESEKYAHVTYFFNGGDEKPFLNEDRILIPSKPVKSFDQTPAMSAYEITDAAYGAIKRGYYDFVLINYANPDMVGHTGNLAATIQAIEALDGQIPRIVDLVTGIGGVVFITGDHGNAEQMIEPTTGKMDKEHSTNPVPFIMLSPFNGLHEPQNVDAVWESMKNPAGILADIGPTILDVMSLPKPVDMSGESLLANFMPLLPAGR